MSTKSPKHAAASQRPVRGVAKSIAEDFATRTNATIAALLALVGITGLAGGLEAAEPEGFISVSAPIGENPPESPVELHVEPLDIEIRRTYVKDGARIVEARVTNTASRPLPSFDFMRMFTLKNSTLKEDEQPKFEEQFFRLKEVGEVPDDLFGDVIILNPGVLLDVAMLFADPQNGTGVGQALAADTLFLESSEYKVSFLDGTKQWLYGDVAAEVKLK